MTVSYTGQVATCRGFGCFLKLLGRWRGSIYKLVWLDLTTFLFLYYTLNLTYRLILNPDQKKTFEALVKYCDEHSNLIPLSFVLGFYVSIVMTRWWNQYTSIPFPASIAVFVSATVQGQDERGRLMRRTIMRYVCLCITMVLGNLSPLVKKRFPSYRHYIEAGMMNENECKIIEDLNMKYPKHEKYWLPLVWAAGIITRARKEGRIRDDFAVKTILDELNKVRGHCGTLLSYDAISIPLVYTQVVTIAVYSFFLVGLMGQQWIEDKGNRVDLYFPFFSLLQFFFYMGWLKVAEQLINPFGEDDDDFEVSWMIDRNLQASYLIVDEMHHDHPELLKDQYWDSVLTTELPYTVATKNNREDPPAPSTANIAVSQKKAEIIPMAPSVLKLNESGKNPSNYDLPDNGDEKVSRPGSRQGEAGGPSVQTIADTIGRVNTATSIFKRLLSRKDSKRDTNSRPVSGAPNAANTPAHISSVKTPEVGEQIALTPMRNGDNQATAQIVASDPVDIPGQAPPPSYSRFHSIQIQGEGSSVLPPPGGEDMLSSSAPAGNKMPASSSHLDTKTEVDRTLFGSQQSKGSAAEENDPIPLAGDDFEKLRQEREAARTARQKEKMAASIVTQQSMVNQIELQEVLSEALMKPPELVRGNSSPTADA